MSNMAAFVAATMGGALVVEFSLLLGLVLLLQLRRIFGFIASYFQGENIHG
jgi:hypothetical protein